MLNTFYDSYRILMKVYGQKTYIKQAINSEIIEPINRATVIKTCYGVVENDVFIDYILSAYCDKRPKLPVRVVLKIAIYNLRFFDKSPYAVTDNAVELLKKLGKGANAGFANAVLRKYVKTGESLPFPEEYHKKLSVAYSYPEFAINMLESYYGKETTEKIVSYREPHNYVRFDKSVDGEKYLTERGKEFVSTPFFNLFDVRNFARDDGYDKGLYTFQSIGSVAICDAVPADKILFDCCAAPGGKSVLLSDKFEKVYSFELHEHRAQLIKAYAERMGKTNVSVVTSDSSVRNDEYVGRADAVLCDCPCSGFGVACENPDVKLNKTEDNVKELAETQLKILKNCADYVKKGGYLIYSTCSVFTEENDCVIDAFAPEENGFGVVPVESPLCGLKTRRGTQFLPHISMGAGFYICKMRKI